MKTNNKHNLLKKGTFIILISLGVALIAECLIFNFRAVFSKEKERQFSLEDVEQDGFSYSDGTLTSESKDAMVTLRFDKYYWKSLDIVYTYDESKICPVEFWVTGPENITEDAASAKYSFPKSEGSDEVFKISVDDKVECVTLNFSRSGVQIKELRLANDFLFNVPRFFIIFSVAFCIGVIWFTRDLFVNREHVLFMLIGLLMGLSLIIGSPYYKQSWDDETHFATAYKLSYVIQGKDIEWSKAAQDFVDVSINRSDTYEEHLEAIAEVDENGKIVDHVEENPGILSFIGNIGFLPASIFMLIARLLNMPFHLMFAAGKLANLLLYLCVMYFAIKTVKVGKIFMCVLALMPTTLYLATSYSLDGVVFSFMMLGFSVFLTEYLEPEKKISVKRQIVYVLSMIMAALPKALYIPMVLTGLALPKSKYSSKRNRYIFRTVVVLSCFVVLVPVLFAAPDLSDARGGDTNVMSQLGYIYYHFFRAVKMFIGDIVSTLPEYVFGGLGKVSFNILGTMEDKLAAVPPILMVFVLLTESWNGVKKKIGKYTVLWIWLLTAGVIGMMWVAMYLAYTPVGARTVVGVQPRYYAPLIFPIFMTLTTDKIQCHISKRNYSRAVFTTSMLLVAACIWGLVIFV